MDGPCRPYQVEDVPRSFLADQIMMNYVGSEAGIIRCDDDIALVQPVAEKRDTNVNRQMLRASALGKLSCRPGSE